ncbi:glycoprotein-N-acetylgalactosamine 3-beta-galactosyltransferase 1-like isoform X1 [Argopecten irradians]|uniref:glycoprotein-N-acetylgalactosamine 3-beta-galactosyltransferase 1-like isoform X1 n=1 Tax=Argopecten irradians TaxID=31199 RepID=UPI00371DF5D4
MRVMAEDRVSRLFMLVCCCFCITTLLMTYNTFFIDEEIVEVNEDEEDLYHDIQNRNFRDKDRPVNMGSHTHDDDDRTKADELYNRVRVLCWIMTSPSNLDRKGLAVRTTWAKRCNKYIFFSSVTNDSFPTVGLNVSEGRQHLTSKTVQAFKYCYENYGNSFDWFLKADDDTYVIVENLRFFLSHHNPKDLVYFGHRFKVIVKQGYFSGGAGYVFSRQTLKKFVEVGLRNPLLCRRDGGAEDAEIGKCMQRLEVKVGDSLDINGRESFHPFTPIAHLQGNYPGWFYNQTFHKAQKGLGCCSDYSVSFHYMSPADMYLMDYLVYHLRPFGLHRKDTKTNYFIPEGKR